MSVTQARLEQLLPEVVDIARRAGEKILEVNLRDGDITIKTDKSPVTTADIASHNFIRYALAEISDWPMLSEESSHVPYEKRKTWNELWIVDPLDGTQGYIRGSKDYAVNIALVSEHVPVLGVVYVPALGECYFAYSEGGAHKSERDGAARRIHTREAPMGDPTIAISVAYSGKTTMRFLERLGAHRLVKRDSIIKSCMVAEGLADLYARFGPTGEWDTAAGQCILEEAGGRLTDMQGNPFRYNMRESVINPPFIAAAPSAPDWRAILTEMGYFDEKKEH